MLLPTAGSAFRGNTVTADGAYIAQCNNTAARLENYLPYRNGMVQLKRVYEPASEQDGVRFLVERLWPRGIRKQDLSIDAWQKDAGPSDQLRKWFAHDPRKWERFKEKYFSELDARPEAWQPILKSARHRTVTLVYSSHDAEHNNALALKQYLDRKAPRRR